MEPQVGLTAILTTDVARIGGAPVPAGTIMVICGRAGRQLWNLARREDPERIVLCGVTADRFRVPKQRERSQ